MPDRRSAFVAAVISNRTINYEEEEESPAGRAKRCVSSDISTRFTLVTGGGCVGVSPPAAYPRWTENH